MRMIYEMIRELKSGYFFEAHDYKSADSGKREEIDVEENNVLLGKSVVDFQRPKNWGHCVRRLLPT